MGGSIPQSSPTCIRSAVAIRPAANLGLGMMMRLVTVLLLLLRGLGLRSLLLSLMMVRMLMSMQLLPPLGLLFGRLDRIVFLHKRAGRQKHFG